MSKPSPEEQIFAEQKKIIDHFPSGKWDEKLAVVKKQFAEAKEWEAKEQALHAMGTFLRELGTEMGPLLDTAISEAFPEEYS